MHLPDFYVDAIAFHHSHDKFRETLDNPVLADAVRLASLFPHCLSAWNSRDAEAVQALLSRAAPALMDPGRFLETVNKELALLQAYFEPTGKTRIDLKELLAAASREAADCTTQLVGTVHEMMQQTIQAGQQVNQIIKEHSRLEEAAHRDPLTGCTEPRRPGEQGTSRRSRRRCGTATASPSSTWTWTTSRRSTTRAATSGAMPP